MKVVTLTLSVIVLVSFLSPVHAQTDERKCHVLEFKDFAYTPFRVKMTHDPAIKQTITDEHNDPQSRLIFDQVELEQTETPTTLGFYTNSTDFWRIDIDLEYNIEAIASEPRETLIVFQSNNREYFSSPFFDTGFTSCFHFEINAKPPVVQLTQAQTLAVADKMAKENIMGITNSNYELVDAVVTSSERNDFMAVIFSGIFVAIIVGGFLQRRSGRKLKIELTLEKQELQKERSLTKLDRLHAKTERQASEQERIEFNDSLKSSFNGIADQVMMLARHLDLEMKRATFRSPYIRIEELNKVELPKKIETQIEPEKPNTPEEEKANEEEFQKQYLGDTIENLEKIDPKDRVRHVAEKISNLPKMIKDIKDSRKDSTPSIRDKAYFIRLYSDELKGDPIKAYEQYVIVQKEWNEKPTDVKLAELYALHELAQEKKT
jgi:hypothetical protein